ncbi:MAG: hypothetical protein M1114_02250 [Candidatus Dependentiae bacterium]|nr:hypothetical protein [Candidatus Dependentiae bacterium]
MKIRILLFLSLLSLAHAKIINAMPVAQPTNHYYLSMDWLYQIASYSPYSLDIPEVRNNLRYYIRMTENQLAYLKLQDDFKEKIQFNHNAPALKTLSAGTCLLAIACAFISKSYEVYRNDYSRSAEACKEVLFGCGITVGVLPSLVALLLGGVTYKDTFNFKSWLKERIVTTTNILDRLHAIELIMQQEIQQ